MFEFPEWCIRLSEAIGDDDVPINYVSKFREVGLMCLDGGTSYLLLEFCPFCGSALAKSLRDVWFDRLEALGLEPGDSGIPAELKTDHWWKVEGMPS